MHRHPAFSSRPLVVLVFLCIGTILLLKFAFVPSVTGIAKANNPPALTSGEFLIANLPLASAEAPAIHKSQVVWHDDQNGPTDIWGYDLNRQESYPLTVQRQAQLNPDIGDDLVVYEDNRNGNWDIYATSLSQGEVKPVVQRDHHQRYPRVWGDYVVYQDETSDASQSDVYLHHLSTGVTTPLAVAPGFQGKPDIDNHWVVWYDRRDDRGQLGVYDLRSQGYHFHPINCAGSCTPRIHGDEVVWSEWRNGHADIYLYNLATRQETPIFTGMGDQIYPVISEALIAWQDQATHGNWDVFVYVRNSGVLFPVSVEPSRQIRPAVAGNTVIWQDNRSHRWEIYGLRWEGAPPPAPTWPLANPRNLTVGALPGGKLRLTWSDQSTDEQDFVIQRAAGVFTGDWQDFATTPANTTVFTDSQTMIGQSYWYRLRARNAQGDSGYSNESYSTAVGDDLPSADEQYLHFLINETRMAPAAWGHPELSAVNPVGWHVNLAAAARAHALGMDNADCCQGHTDLEGRGPGERAAASDYPYLAAENLFVGQSGATGMEAVHRGFLDSPGHLKAIMDPAARQAALGFAPQGRGTVVELFSAGPPEVVVPPLPSSSVVPYSGGADTTYEFLVAFWNPDLRPPSRAVVIIDGVEYPLTLRSGHPGRGAYTYRTKLPLGQHRYAFEFAWNDALNLPQSARLPATGFASGPLVRPARPDLVLEGLDASQVLYDHNSNVFISVRNRGETPAANVTVQLYLGHPRNGGVSIGGQTLARLDPDAIQTLALSWQPPSAGDYLLYAWVDPANVLDESNENNNLVTAIAKARPYTRKWYVNGAAGRPGNGRTSARPFLAITTALEWTRAGDLVFVAPGTYEGKVQVPPGVWLIGAGYQRTVIRGTGGGSVITLNEQSRVSGFTITGSGPDYWDAGVYIDGKISATVTNNHITDNGMGIAHACFTPPCTGKALIANNIISRNRHTGINTHATLPRIVNNIVISNDVGIHVDVDGSVVRNNIVVANNVGIIGGGKQITIGYNNLWENKEAYQGVEEIGPGASAVDPQFAAPNQDDYRLQPSSPLIDAGDPDPAYNDADGSRNDLGVGGGRLEEPMPDPSLTVALNALAASQDERWRIDYTVVLTATGGSVETVAVTTTLPLHTTYITGSAVTGQGQVAEGSPLLFDIGAISANQAVSLTYAVLTNAPLTTTTRFASPLLITWEGGSLEEKYEIEIVVENPVDRQRVFLPLVDR